MKKTKVDYSGFRLSRLREPRFSHLLLLLGWPVYLLLFALTERFIPAERCTPVHCPLDDLIPFCEWFLIPYVFWYALIVLSLGYFLRYDVESFRRLQTFFILVQTAAMVCYLLFPTRQDLRPAVFPRENLLTAGVSLLYRVDTNTGVCPSLHVACSLGIASVWLRKRDALPVQRIFVAVSAVLICLSTVFLKQHSVVDGLAALPVCLLAEGLLSVGRFRRAVRLRHPAA